MYGAASNSKPLIILYQPDASLREGLEVVLGDHYRLTSACRLPEVPKLLEFELPALLIIDADHFASLHEVLTAVHQAHKNLRILLLAGEFSLDQQLEAIRLLDCAAAFLTKPFSPAHLLEKVHTLIQGYSDSSIRHHIVRIAL